MHTHTYAQVAVSPEDDTSKAQVQHSLCTEGALCGLQSTEMGKAHTDLKGSFGGKFPYETPLEFKY